MFLFFVLQPILFVCNLFHAQLKTTTLVELSPSNNPQYTVFENYYNLFKQPPYIE